LWLALTSGATALPNGTNVSIIINGPTFPLPHLQTLATHDHHINFSKEQPHPSTVNPL